MGVNLFSTQGRMRRQQYIITTVCIILFGLLLYGIFIFAAYDRMVIVAILCYLLWALSYILFLIQSVKRLHDMDVSGGYVMIMFVPLINTIYALYLLFAPPSPPSPAANRFGEDPRIAKPFQTPTPTPTPPNPPYPDPYHNPNPNPLPPIPPPPQKSHGDEYPGGGNPYQ